MIQNRELVLEDFKQVTLPGDQYYLSARIGDYEITLEPHLVTGYCVGLYYKQQSLALEKRAIWLKNHPASTVPPNIPSKIIVRALEYANQLFSKYIYEQSNQQPAEGYRGAMAQNRQE